MRDRSSPKYKAQQVRWKMAAKARKAKFIREYRVKKGCLVCGTKNPHVLDFEHRLPEEKLPSLRKYPQWSQLTWKQIHVELDKCDVMCANHHRIRTAWLREVARVGHIKSIVL